jgi:hypothetical protein
VCPNGGFGVWWLFPPAVGQLNYCQHNRLYEANNPEHDHLELKMNTVFWIIQVILGIKLITVSYTHGLRQSQPTMQDAIRKMGRFSQPLLYLIAVCTFIGAMGLILPGVLGASARITPVTAALLSIMLLCSIIFHVKCREKPNIFVSVILFAFAVFVAYGRRVLYSL